MVGSITYSEEEIAWRAVSSDESLYDQARVKRR
jgi:hypothetical protein